MLVHRGLYDKDVCAGSATALNRIENEEELYNYLNSHDGGD